jgi:hypothetical protein
MGDSWARAVLRWAGRVLGWLVVFAVGTVVTTAFTLVLAWGPLALRARGHGAPTAGAVPVE